MVGAILVIMMAAMTSLLMVDYDAARNRQHCLQAYWNARSGLERYQTTGQLPASDNPSGKSSLTITGDERCTASISAQGDVRFDGVSGHQHRSIVLPQGQVDRAYEAVP